MKLNHPTLLLLLLSLCYTGLAAIEIEGSYVKLKDDDGSVFAYKMKASSDTEEKQKKSVYKFPTLRNSVLLMHVISGKKEIFRDYSHANAIDPFGPIPNQDIESPKGSAISIFFNKYGIVVDDDEVAFDGEYIFLAGINDNDAKKASFLLRVLQDSSKAQQELDTINNAKQNQSR